MNITDVLTEHAGRRPSHPAIEDGDRVITYAELDSRVVGAAANLQAAGIAPGDVVGVMLGDSAEYLITLLGLARAGAVMLAIDGRSPMAEKRRAVENANVKAVIASANSGAIGGSRIVPVSMICQPPTAKFRRPSLDVDHPLVIAQSSGTTGVAKTFVWSHARMRLQAPRHQRCLHLTGEDRYFALIRMSFFWEREICLVLFCLGATIVVNRTQSLKAFVNRVSADRITMLALTPVHLASLLALPAERTPLFPSVRAMVSGSAPFAHERRLLVRQKLTPNFYEQLGTNEAGLLILGAPADQDARPGAIGRVVDGVEAQVLGADGRPLPPGEVGLAGFRGEGFPSEYIGNREATERAFRNGWFYPGDLAAIDADGYFFFKGRADDVINSEGAKFYPVEVEKALLAHPAVSEAAVFGWPHDRHGEVAVACVVLTGQITASELGKFCLQHIASYKVPQWIMFMTELPKNSAGKVLKSRLKQTFRDMRDKQVGSS